MSRQLLISLGILLLVFGSGVVLGLFMGSVPAASDLSEKSTGGASSGFFTGPEVQDQVQADTLLSSRIRDLEKALAEQKTDQKAILADRLAFFKKYHEQIRLSAFDDDLKVTPEMSEILGLSKKEQQAIEQHLAETKSEMDKMEDANTVLAKQTATGVTYDISADPQGKAIKDKLNSSISADIGDDRAGLFMSHLDYSENTQFSDFAEQKREIDITWTTQNGNPVYTTKVRSVGPDGDSTRSTAGNMVQPQFHKYLPTDSTP